MDTSNNLHRRSNARSLALLKGEEMEIKLTFLDKVIDIRRKYDTPIEVHFFIFIAGLLLGILLNW